MSFLNDLPSWNPENFSKLSGQKANSVSKVVHDVPVRQNEVSISNEKKSFILRYLEKHFVTDVNLEEKKSRKRSDDCSDDPSEKKVRKR
ncbi:unnamed protein product [Auanema sp. JU1783]|nr:unnamed protein product [Auanema sp. JU1783]